VLCVYNLKTIVKINMNCLEEFFQDVSKFFREVMNNENEKETNSNVLKEVNEDFSIEEKDCEKVEKVEEKVDEKVDEKAEEKVDEKAEEKRCEKVKDNDFEDDMVIIETTTQILLTPIECNENYI